MNDPVIDTDLNHQEKEEMIVTETDVLKDVANHLEIRHTQITNDLTAEKIVDKKTTEDLDHRIEINLMKGSRTTNGKTIHRCHQWHHRIHMHQTIRQCHLRHISRCKWEFNRTIDKCSHQEELIQTTYQCSQIINPPMVMVNNRTRNMLPPFKIFVNWFNRPTERILTPIGVIQTERNSSEQYMPIHQGNMCP